MPDANISYVASGEIQVSRFVKQGGAPFYVAPAGVGDKPLGVSQEGSTNTPLRDVTSYPAARDGERLKVYGDNDDTILVVGATVSGGNYLKPDANSFGIPVTAATDWYGFRAYENCVSGGLCRGRVMIGQGS